MKSAVKDPRVNHVKLSSLAGNYDSVIAEYDEKNDEIVKLDLVERADSDVRTLLNRSGGKVVIED